MRRFTIAIWFGLMLVVLPVWLVSQEEDRSGAEALLRHEWGVSAMLHTDGFGINGRNIRAGTYYKKWFYELDIVGMKHPKEVKTINSFYPNTKSFIYGKINSLFITRAGGGRMQLLNREPLWDYGVEVRLFYGAGFSAGLTKPVYLYVIQDNSSYFSGITRNLEKYNPEKHGVWDIQGRGPFTKGFNELGFYPGGYAKLGFNFEFANANDKIAALETGAILDLYPDKIPIMALNENKQWFLSFYISFYIGGRYN
ncbi:MAG: hypothetical protein ACQESZ_03235 [Bacteroidota bacterium]